MQVFCSLWISGFMQVFFMGCESVDPVGLCRFSALCGCRFSIFYESVGLCSFSGLWINGPNGHMWVCSPLWIQVYYSSWISGFMQVFLLSVNKRNQFIYYLFFFFFTLSVLCWCRFVVLCELVDFCCLWISGTSFFFFLHVFSSLWIQVFSSPWIQVFCSLWISGFIPIFYCTCIRFLLFVTRFSAGCASGFCWLFVYQWIQISVDAVSCGCRFYYAGAFSGCMSQQLSVDAVLLWMHVSL